jgi:hypothetical protein
MALGFSVWLRDVGRLYIRYITIALAAIPFAAVASWSMHAGWHEHVSLSLCLVLAVVTASLIWNRLGRRRDESQNSKTTSFDNEWADLLKVGMKHFSIAGDDVAAYTRQEVLAPILVADSPQSQSLEFLCSQHHQTAVDQWRGPVIAEPEDALQQLMKGKREPNLRKQPMRRVNSQTLVPSVPQQSSFPQAQLLHAGSR